MAQGLVYLGAPFSAALTKRLPRHQKHLIVAGWLLCILGLFTASFADTVPSLIASQGLLYGVGFVALFFPILNFLSEWWIVRKGMALGILSSASGLTGTFMPLVLNVLLHRYGYRTTLRACAVAMLVVTGPLLPFLKGRLPPSHSVTQPRTDLSFFRKPLFWFFAAANAVQGLGFFIPPVFVTSYAEGIGLSTTQAALLLTVMAIAQTIGQCALGWLSDTKIHVSVLSSTCCIVAAIATASLWGLGKTLWALMLYSILYGFFAYGFGTLRVAMGRAVSPEPSTMLATYSSFACLQGLGIVLVGPVTAGLMSGNIVISEYGASLYKATVIFVTASSTAGGVLAAAPYMLKRWTIILS